jgi:hypothetical protein
MTRARRIGLKAGVAREAQMKITKLARECVMVGAMVGICLSSSANDVDASSANMPRDGRHDFDFNIGEWRTHIRRILNPFAGAPESIELTGTVIVRKVWDGRAQLEEIEADGPKGHWEGLTLFLYNPGARQWSQTFVDSSKGVIRGVWSEITPDAHRFEEAYSEDGGKSWAPAFVANLTRIKK